MRRRIGDADVASGRAVRVVFANGLQAVGGGVVDPPQKIDIQQRFVVREPVVDATVGVEIADVVPSDRFVGEEVLLATADVPVADVGVAKLLRLVAAEELRRNEFVEAASEIRDRLEHLRIPDRLSLRAWHCSPEMQAL